MFLFRNSIRSFFFLRIRIYRFFCLSTLFFNKGILIRFLGFCPIRTKKSCPPFSSLERFASVSFADETESSFVSSLSETTSFDTDESVIVSSTFSLEFLGVALEFFWWA